MLQRTHHIGNFETIRDFTDIIGNLEVIIWIIHVSTEIEKVMIEQRSLRLSLATTEQTNCVNKTLYLIENKSYDKFKKH